MLRLPVLLVAGWGAVVFAWAFSNPPFAAPDEGMHYLRVLSVEQGDLVGPKTSPDAVIGVTDVQREWLVQLARTVEVPTGLAPPDAACYVFDRDSSAACLGGYGPNSGPDLTTTLVGTYQPLPYLLPAVATKTADSPAEALRLGRLACALLAVSLLALAVAAAWDARAPGLSLLGPALAATPMVLFCSSILNGSSLEITAGIAFIACLFRLARDRPPPTWPWIGIGLSGVAFALSRSAAPIWLIVLLPVVLAFATPRETWHKLKAGGRPAVVAGVAIAAAVALNLVWESRYGPEVPVSLTNARRAVEDGVDALPFWLQEMVGKFGYLEFDLPLFVYVFWGAVTLAAVALALRFAPIRGKVVLAICVFALAAFPLALYVLTQRHTGYGVQGRHVLPVLVIVPLLAGELLRRRRDELPAKWVPCLIAVALTGAALVHFTALYWNARRSGVGLDGPLVFVGNAEWSPPVGWGLWLALAAVGAACVCATGVLAAKAEAAQEQQRGLAQASPTGQ